MKICLISMPFSRLDYPSLALTQIQSILKQYYGNKATVDILYLNHDFASELGIGTYEFFIGNSIYIHSTDPTHNSGEIISRTENKKYDGVGDWIFRATAFPALRDNTEEYLRRYFKNQQALIDMILQTRAKVNTIIDQCISKYHLISYDIVALTSMFYQQLANISLLRRIKQYNPAVITVVGGCNTEGESADALIELCGDCIDYVYTGAGYKDIGYFFDSIFSQKFKERVYRSTETDINDVIPLDYTPYLQSLENHFPAGKIEPILFFETSRGCWLGQKRRCTFCDYNKTNINYRKMKSDKAIDYLNNLFGQHSNQCRYYWAVDAIMPIDYLERVLPYLTIPKHIKIFYEVTPRLPKNKIEKLAKYHITLVQAGIEALDQNTLTLLKKTNTVYDNLTFLKNCTLFGLAPLWNLLAGIPEEDPKRYFQLKKLLPLLYHLCPPTGIWPISYDKNSEYVVKRRDYGLDLSPKTEKISYIYPPESLIPFVYFYENRKEGDILTFYVLKQIEDINFLIKKWRARWYGKNKGVFPSLYIIREEKAIYIYDSRDGNPKNISLSEETLAFLHRIDNEIVLFSSLNDSEKRLLDVLLLYEWVMIDNERLISLVLPEKPRYNLQSNQIQWIWK